MPDSAPTRTEGAGEAAFFLYLRSAPTAPVTILLPRSDSTEGFVSPASVAFTPSNWDTPQSVVITGVSETALDGSVDYAIVTGAAVSADFDYGGLSVSDVLATNTDIVPYEQEAYVKESITSQ